MNIPIVIQGIIAKVPKRLLENHLTSRMETKERIYGGKYNGRWRDSIKEVPVYTNHGTHITCGLGAILFLAKNNPLVDIEFKRFDPSRSKLTNIDIPDRVVNDEKYRVNGKDRFYFHEALDACRKNYCGTVKLPTGSGKTVIELVLAHNQVREIGTGIIIVPTHAIREQFEKSAKRFGIRVTDYRTWLSLEDNEPHILLTTPKVVYNDIEAVETWVKHQTSQDFRSMMYKHHEIKWIIADECHHSGCDTWNRLFSGLPNLSRSHGFSALPIEENIQNAINFSSISYDDALTISTCGPVIYERSTQELKEFLNIPKLINVDYQWPASFKGLWTDDWHKLRGYVLDNNERIYYIASIINWLSDRGYISITHVVELDLVDKILKACNSKNVVSWTGGGVVKTTNGFLTVDDLRTEAGKSIFGIVCTSHAIEGVDLNIPIAVTFLAEGKKIRATVQKTGRAVRPSDGHSLVINLWDKGISILPRHSKERASGVQEEFNCDIYNAKSFDHFKTIINHLEGN